MSKSATRQKLTFMVPTYLLEIADDQARTMGLDRYDVLRMAIGQGLMAIRVQQKIQKEPERYLAELRDLTSGKPDAMEKLDKKVSDDVLADMELRFGKEKKKTQTD